MKDIGYRLLKIWIKCGLYFYYGRIKITGLENVPLNSPVLFLPNHQSALMDVLLIVVDCNRKPFFLTRSDVFKKPMLKKFFTYLRMVPIYRIRDGREALKNNEAIFNQCAALFRNNHAIVMFPEANHNIKRRVRPLSKGFTRILFNALEQNPDQDIHIVPVGLNYVSNKGFPDKVSLYYGRSIIVNNLYDSNNVQSSVNVVKEAVSDRLKNLTTHIDDEENYDNIIHQFNARGVDYLNPFETNRTLKTLNSADKPDISKLSSNTFSFIAQGIFTLLNFPIILFWRIWAKPKVWEPEFTATLRFAFALLLYPIYYFLLLVIFTLTFNTSIAFCVVIGILLYNWMFVFFSK